VSKRRRLSDKPATATFLRDRSARLLVMRPHVVERAIGLAALVGCTAACQTGMAGISPSDTPTAAHTGGWRSVDVPIAPSPDDWLFGVTSISPTDIWAVGGRTPDGEPTALHWDGAGWSASEPLPTGQPPSPRDPASLRAVSASGPNDAWAAGDQHQPFLVHWAAGAWSVVPVPSAAAGQIDDVAAVSPTDAWLAGSPWNHPGTPTIEHWDGRSWSPVPTPAVPTAGQGSQVRHLTAVSSRDVWAIGERDHDCLIEHWDGNRWSLVDCPAPAGAAETYLTAAAVLSATDIWAVGAWAPHQVGPAIGGERALVEHWDGVAWHVMPAPDLLYPLESVAARSDTDIVAATPYQPDGVARWGRIPMANGRAPSRRPRRFPDVHLGPGRRDGWADLGGRRGHESRCHCRSGDSGPTEPTADPRQRSLVHRRHHAATRSSVLTSSIKAVTRSPDQVAGRYGSRIGPPHSSVGGHRARKSLASFTNGTAGTVAGTLWLHVSRGPATCAIWSRVSPRGWDPSAARSALAGWTCRSA
jgi:hypothetical protein